VIDCLIDHSFYLFFSFPSANQIARQLTLIEWDLWKKIMPWECLNQAWAKAGRDEKVTCRARRVQRR
jgi:hypothetical protein